MKNTLVHEHRGDVLENMHSGVICGVNAQKEVLYRVGDVEHYTFFRSASKPLQAIPAFLAEIDVKYDLTAEEAALFTASHRGEAYHIAALQSMQQKLDVDEASLFCPYAYPLNEAPKQEMLRQHEEKRRLYHNCSGKHMGFIAVCKEKGYPIEGYWEADHPLQQHIKEIIAYLAEMDVADVEVGIDGCGVPVFAIPLKHMAISTLKLACPDLIEDEAIRKAVIRMTEAMNEGFQMVASHQFICSALLEDPNIVAKGGAKGVYCFGLKKERLAFALKVFDGSEEVWPLIIASILQQINYDNADTIARVQQLRPTTVKTDSGLSVGRFQTVFQLHM